MKINFAFVAPKKINAEKAQNFHIFEGHYDPRKRQFEPSDNKSCCGKCHCNTSSDYARVCELDCTIEEARKRAREVAMRYEDSGKRVCGQCVASLFSDGI